MNYTEITCKSDGSFYRVKTNGGISALFHRLVPNNINSESVTRRLRAFKNTGEYICCGIESYKRDDYEDDNEIELGYFTKSGNKIVIDNTYEEKNNDEEIELLTLQIEKLEKKLQRARDENTVHRGYKRKDCRLENQADILVDEISYMIKDFKPLPKFDFKPEPYGDCVAIMQLSDHHFGGKVDMENNKVDSYILRDRLLEYTKETLKDMNIRKTNKIHITMLGDMINLDSHRDLLLSRDCTRAEALMIAYDSFCEMIDVLLEARCDIEMSSVCGNESRIFGLEKHTSETEEIKNNFDYLIYQMLKRRYKHLVNFINDGDKLETVINVNGKWIGITHGDKLKHGNLKNEFEKFKLRMFDKFGVMIDYMMIGHIHEALITPNFARNSSLVGASYYSDRSLNMTSPDISQNLHFVYKDKMHSYRIEVGDNNGVINI